MEWNGKTESIHSILIQQRQKPVLQERAEQPYIDVAGDIVTI